MNDPVQFTYRTTPELAVEQVLMLLRKRKHLSGMRLFAGFLLLVSGATWVFFLTGHNFRDGGVIPRFVCPVLGIVVLSGCTKRGLQQWMKLGAKRQEGVVGKQVVGKLSEVGLRLDFQGGTSFTSTWEQFTEFSAHQAGLFSFTKSLTVFLLPRGGFATPAEFEAAVSLARRALVLPRSKM